MNNLKGELSVMNNLGIKPNYAALGRKYGMDWRTVKKYHNGYESVSHRSLYNHVPSHVRDRIW